MRVHTSTFLDYVRYIQVFIYLKNYHSTSILVHDHDISAAAKITADWHLIFDISCANTLLLKNEFHQPPSWNFSNHLCKSRLLQHCAMTSRCPDTMTLRSTVWIFASSHMNAVVVRQTDQCQCNRCERLAKTHSPATFLDGVQIKQLPWSTQLLRNLLFGMHLVKIEC